MAQTIQKENKKFSEWLETMVSEESEDHYYIGGTAIEKGETADLQVAFEAGQSEERTRILKVLKNSFDELEKNFYVICKEVRDDLTLKETENEGGHNCRNFRDWEKKAISAVKEMKP